MYPLTHIYFARKVLGNLDDATTLGSIFPDMVILCGIPWEESHRLGLKLWPHFKDAPFPLSRFARGVITHGIEPPGLDYFSDEQYETFEKGYCFEKARPLVDQVIEALSIKPEDGWWKAHNFVEMGIELYIFDRNPELLSQMRQSFKNQSLIELLVAHLSPLLVSRTKHLEACFSIFERFVMEEEIDAELLAVRYERQIYHRHNIDSVDTDYCRELIIKGRQIIEDEIEDFFEDVKKKMEPLWTQLKQ